MYDTHITFFSSLLKVRLKSENEHVVISYNYPGELMKFIII